MNFGTLCCGTRLSVFLSNMYSSFAGQTVEREQKSKHYLVAWAQNFKFCVLSDWGRRLGDRTVFLSFRALTNLFAIKLPLELSGKDYSSPELVLV